jgi:nitrite reductase (NO-forming)
MSTRNLIAAGVIIVMLIAAMVGVLILNSAPATKSPNTVGTSSSTTSLNTTTISSTSSSQSSSSTSSTPATDVNVTLKSYSITPNVINADPGETLRVKVTNSDSTHDFVVPELNAATRLLGAGESQIIEITIPTNAAGKTYEYYCSVSNHRSMGMTGTIKVRN